MLTYFIVRKFEIVELNKLKIRYFRCSNDFSSSVLDISGEIWVELSQSLEGIQGDHLFHISCFHACALAGWLRVFLVLE